ncbi:hypothetical protein D9757_006767 [Collybiopsis confluens]|uniref:RING-type domain-containing protein n=1 Tax=Collybiopsis confluens TaxID=2823264 RepID=A0A8H5M9F3_9AGAR|nr:hypothetical protein D9757_006767 [Collybiopsis confluens]
MRDICSAKNVFIQTSVSSLCKSSSIVERKGLIGAVTQKKDIKRQKERLETLKMQAEAERTRAKQAARERVLAEFEKGQVGLAAAPNKVTTSSGSTNSESRSSKRKFEFDTSTVENLALEAEEAALRQIEKEQAEALKHKLPDFWLPSLTPTYTSSGDPRSLQDVKVQTTCRGGNPKHSIAMKDLTPVKFTFDKSQDSSSEQAICPSCKKVLSNNTLIFLAKPCAHVTCKTCTETLVRPAKQCVVCDTPLKVNGDPSKGNKVKGEKSEKGDIIEIRREGTGFAGGGLAETSKAGVAFQG